MNTIQGLQGEVRINETFWGQYGDLLWIEYVASKKKYEIFETASVISYIF